MKKYKLLFLDLEMPYLIREDSRYPVAGSSVRQYALVRGIASLGHRVGILTRKGAKKYIQKKVEFDLVESFAQSEGSQKLRWFYHIYPKIYYAIKNYEPDIVFQRAAGTITGVTAFVSKQLGIPFIYHATNDIDADGRYKDNLRYIDIKLYEYGIKNADRLIVQNTYQKREFLKKWDNKTIDIIHNPFFYEGALPGLKSVKDRKYVAWLGLFQYQKNLPALLNIVRNSPEVEFQIAGTYSLSCTDDIKETVRQIANCSNVKMRGYLKRHEIISFLSEAIVLLNTSYYEGFSNTFLESFAAGTPVITNMIDPDDIIRNNNLGIVAQNYEEIPDRLDEMICRNNSNKMAEECRNYLLENHDSRVIAKKFIENISQHSNSLDFYKRAVFQSI